MTPTSSKLAIRLAREGLTRNQVKVIFWLLCRLGPDDFMLSDSAAKRTLDELRKLGFIEGQASGGWKLCAHVRGMFSDPMERTADDPPRYPPKPEPKPAPDPAQPPPHPFTLRPPNQQLWAREAVKLAGMATDQDTLEAVALRKFGRA